MTELPLVVIDVQRGGPSTGLPTKTEQSDLFQAFYGRNGEAPLAVLAPATPSDCFRMVFEAGRIALKYMTPVIVLSDGYLGNGSEPWLLPKTDSLADLTPSFYKKPERYYPYSRDEETLARLWAIPGTPDLEHRIGGLEKLDGTGSISYDATNHEHMVRVRAEKINRIAGDIPSASVEGKPEGDLLVVGWGSTYGAIRTAVQRHQNAGHAVSHLHLRYLFPMQYNVGEIFKKFKQILVPELNTGQLLSILRSQYLIQATGFNKIQGVPFHADELYQKIEELLKGI
jgi:2-oxoglutarate ferredoxin oxidoreductase subunit alpha